MTDSRQARSRDSIRALLGLPKSASPLRVRNRADELRAHIEERLAGASSEEFAEARRQEIERLAQALLEVGTAPPPLPKRLWIAAGSGFVLGVLLCAGFFLMRPLAGDEPAAAVLPGYGELSVDADPPASTWKLFHPEDERLLAEDAADGRPHRLAPGLYRLRVENVDCPDSWQREVKIVPAEIQRYSPSVCRGEGQLVVEADQPEARLKIDGMDVGSTGSVPRTLRTGTHSIEVEKPGFVPWQGAVQVRAEEPLTLRAQLVPRPETESPEPAGTETAAAPAPAPAPPAEPPGAAPPQAGQRPSSPDRGATGRGGSKSWHDAIRHQLVSDFDANASGSLDLREEIQSIPCPVLLSVESSYQTGGLAVDMIHLYGFDGSDAPANTLGITPSMRGYAYDRMKGCGLRTGP